MSTCVRKTWRPNTQLWCSWILKCWLKVIPKVDLLLPPILVYALPNLSCPSMGPMVVCSYYQPLYTRFQLLKCSSVELIFFNIDVKLRPNFLHLNLSRSILDWRCVQSFNAVSSQPDLTWMYVLNFSSLFLSWTNGTRGSLFLLPTPVYALPTFHCSLFEPMVACFYYQSCICTSVFLSWIFFVQYWCEVDCAS